MLLVQAHKPLAPAFAPLIESARTRTLSLNPLSFDEVLQVAAELLAGEVAISILWSPIGTPRLAILTNGTDSIRSEMTAMGLTDRFDVIFNSAEIVVSLIAVLGVGRGSTVWARKTPSTSSAARHR